MGVVITQDFISGEDNIVRPLLLEWPDELVRNWNTTKHRLTLANGHVIRFGSAENIESIKGASKVAYWLMDEAALHPKWVHDLLIGRGIDETAPGLITTTPKHGPGNIWLRPLFDRGFDPKWCGDDVPWRRRHFSYNMSTWDNPYIPDDDKDLMKEMYTGPLYEQEILGKFVTDELLMFKHHHFTPENNGYYEEELKDHHLNSYLLVDPAWSESSVKEGCESAILAVSIADEWNIYVRESWAGKVGSHDLEIKIMEMAHRYQIVKLGCEKIGATVLIDNLRRAQGIDTTYGITPLVRHGGRDNKRTRAMAAIPYLENRLCKFPIDRFGNFLNGTDELINQAVGFTGQKGELNDRVDTFADVFNPDMELVQGYRQPEYRKPPDGPKYTVMSQKEVQSVMTGGNDIFDLRLN